jgi:hypothetical protein
MFTCVVNQKSVNKLDLTWKQSFLILIKNPKAGKTGHKKSAKSVFGQFTSMEK